MAIKERRTVIATFILNRSFVFMVGLSCGGLIALAIIEYTARDAGKHQYV